MVAPILKLENPGAAAGEAGGVGFVSGLTAFLERGVGCWVGNAGVGLRAAPGKYCWSLVLGVTRPPTR